jgi:hypothetical protein
MTHFAYISTGAKSAMFTLWLGRTDSLYHPDNYICNLAGFGNEAVAIEKAQDYCDRMSARLGSTVQFRGVWDEPRNQRGSLSARDIDCLKQIESGVTPFGKHAGVAFANLPDSYVMFFADKVNDASLNAVMSAFANACMGVAMERDLIAKREAKREERRNQDALSAFIGTEGERMTFSGVVFSQFKKEADDFNDGYWINKIRCGDDIVVYIGNKFGERDETVTFKATVKRHSEYQGIKSTQVNRPKLMERA